MRYHITARKMLHVWKWSKKWYDMKSFIPITIISHFSSIYLIITTPLTYFLGQVCDNPNCAFKHTCHSCSWGGLRAKTKLNLGMQMGPFGITLFTPTEGSGQVASDSINCYRCHGAGEICTCGRGGAFGFLFHSIQSFFNHNHPASSCAFKTTCPGCSGHAVLPKGTPIVWGTFELPTGPNTASLILPGVSWNLGKLLSSVGSVFLHFSVKCPYFTSEWILPMVLVNNFLFLPHSAQNAMELGWQVTAL
mgnify:CR=1 FL=1